MFYVSQAHGDDIFAQVCIVCVFMAHWMVHLRNTVLQYIWLLYCVEKQLLQFKTLTSKFKKIITI